MIDLCRLRARLAGEEPLTLTSEEAVEIVAELETSRRVIELPLEGPGSSLLAQREMVAQLLVCLAADVTGPAEARLVAGVVVQELSALARLQVRSEKS